MADSLFDTTERTEVGVVYTPIEWAKWLTQESGAYDLWREGAKVCDPTFGHGVMLRALLSLARELGHDVTPDMLARLHGVEIEFGGKSKLFESVLEEFGVQLTPSNFLIGDVLSESITTRYDVLIGNPPWINFSNLPRTLQKKWAPKFIEHGLVINKKQVLLGGSRADLATLVMKKVIDENLTPGGMAAFFIPLSVFFNDGSNDRFRPFAGSGHSYAISKLWDFAGLKIFEDIATRYGAVKLQKGIGQTWPVETCVREGEAWIEHSSVPSDGRQGFWLRQKGHSIAMPTVPVIDARKDQRPRQGVNSCGANAIYIFRRNGGLFENGYGQAVEIESELLFPLLGKEQFRADDCIDAQRFILLPHEKTSGKPLSRSVLEYKYPLATSYLESHEAALRQRKGVMIQGSIKRGLWWSLLGVGSYSFAPLKIFWEALGRDLFQPRIVSGEWQGNQAQHAFCPCESKEDAVKVLKQLTDPSVQKYLEASTMGGTMNWAQPGRVAKLFKYEETQPSLTLT